MDTKWKNSRKKRINITIIALIVIAVINVSLFPLMYKQIINDAGLQTTVENEDVTHLNEEATLMLYVGCYVLYYEHMQSIGEANGSITDFYFPRLAGVTYEQENGEARHVIESRLENWKNDFEVYREEYDYYTIGDGQSHSNTNMQLGEIFESPVSEEVINVLGEKYEYYLALMFDDNGNMQVQILKIGDVNPDVILKSLQSWDRTLRLQNRMEDIYDTNTYPPEKITNFKVAYGIPFGVSEGFQLTGTIYESDEYATVIYHSYSDVFYLCNIIILVILVFILTSSKVWKGDITYTRRGREYFLEIAILVGGPCLLAFDELYARLIAEIGILFYQGNIYENAELVQLLVAFFCVLMILASDYLTLLYIRPVFSLGVVDYIKEYSLLYRMWLGLKRMCSKVIQSLKEVDLSEKPTKTIFKFVAVNFAILAVLMCMWFMGIFGLLVYSIVLFFTLKRYYEKTVRDYEKALNMTKRIAKGEFAQTQEEDFGIFNSMKTELCKIEEGFQKAVEEETKSQRMKTELITNVSHDLKTPLTAITTYVELLKKEDITEEERAEYIDTLSRKSLRLKVLIEDLFEVSKASSQSIVLQYMDVDVVNLMKQVYVEHEEKLAQIGLDLRWNVPTEKVVVSLDNQKTYRIFENLFVNIQKYAMPNSRVYIDILQEEEEVQIVMKNISATELNVRPEELTERFVRGDQSRNTEGSGLGLAIAKSLVEAQKGSFQLVVDGDLFKAVIIFPRKRATAAL